MSLQDVAAITLAVAAALWLLRGWWRGIAAPPCGPPPGAPPGADGFVPFDRIAPPPGPPRATRPPA